MNTSKIFTAAAALMFAASAFAADAPVAPAAAAAAPAAAAAAAQAGAIAHSVAAAATEKGKPTRAQVKAEAIEANNNRRATQVAQFDWFMK